MWCKTLKPMIWWIVKDYKPGILSCIYRLDFSFSWKNWGSSVPSVHFLTLQTMRRYVWLWQLICLKDLSFSVQQRSLSFPELPVLLQARAGVPSFCLYQDTGSKVTRTIDTQSKNICGLEENKRWHGKSASILDLEIRCSVSLLCIFVPSRKLLKLCASVLSFIMNMLIPSP